MQPGAIGTNEAVVTDADTALALGSGDLPVLATPRLVAWLEAAAIVALGAHVQAGSTTVGVRIDIEHLAPTPVGAVVAARAEITGVAGRRITFRVSAGAGDTEIARGEHVRVVVDRERFLTSP